MLVVRAKVFTPQINTIRGEKGCSDAKQVPFFNYSIKYYEQNIKCVKSGQTTTGGDMFR